MTTDVNYFRKDNTQYMKDRANAFLREEAKFKTVKITAFDKPEITEAVIVKWQNIINIIAKIINIPSGLIMKITEDSMEVLLKSINKENPYKEGGSDKLGHGLYCETVIGTNKELLIDNALKYEKWNNNPDVKLDMISYYGIPLQWSDGDFFGTICVLDNKENAYNDDFKKLISEFKFSIEKDLELLRDKLEIENAFNKIKVLSGLLPICSYCKKIRDDKGYWNQIEGYIQEHSDAEFSHSICRECAKKHYPDMDIYDD